jgi:WD40 repeat protein
MPCKSSCNGPDGARLALSIAGGGIAIRDVASGDLDRVLPVAVEAAAISLGSPRLTKSSVFNTVLASDQDGIVRLLDFRTGGRAEVFRTQADFGAVAFHSGGDLFAAMGMYDEAISIGNIRRSGMSRTTYAARARLRSSGSNVSVGATDSST